MFIESAEHSSPTVEWFTLDRLRIGQPARIEAVGFHGDDGVRLMEMGLIPGTIVQVARVAPLGDPIDIVVRGYHLSLRKSEAKEVTVTAQNGEDGLR